MNQAVNLVENVVSINNSLMIIKKERFCSLHDITLVEIPYTEENLISYDYIMKKAGY